MPPHAKPPNETPDVPREATHPAGPAESTSIAEIMTRAVATVPPDLGLDALISLFLERNISGAPVVDAQGRAIGIVSKTDVLRDRFVRGDSGETRPATVHRDGIEVRLEGMHVELPNDVTVREVMTPLAFTLPEDASIARASALMALETVHRVPVVSPAGKVIGILSALDVLRWLARQEGYVLPAHRP
jgi:CBS domain-containing protein